MSAGHIVLGLVFLLLGMIFAARPRVVWTAQTFGWVKSGEPTDFALGAIRVMGIGLLFAAAMLVVVAFSIHPG